MDLFNAWTFDPYVRDLMKEWHVPGLSVAIIHNDKIATKSYGVQSVETKQECTADSLYDIASCSKSFTGAAVALLVEDQEKYPEIQWNTPMSKLLPEDFVMSETEYTQGVTVEDILSHRSGFPNHDATYLGQNAKEPDTAKSVTRNLRNLPVNAPIRSRWQYCNQMFTVATHLVESYAQMPFSEFLHKRIWSPLGMNSTFLHVPPAQAAGLDSRLTSPHIYNNRTNTFRTIEWLHDPEAQGAGSICTSANDMILYIRALLKNQEPFTASLIKQLTTPRMITDPDDDDRLPFTSLMSYALGWEVYWYRGYRIVRHDGSIIGFTSVTWFVPELDFGGVVLGNADGAGDIGVIIMNNLIDEITGVPREKREDWAKLLRAQDEKGKAENKEGYEKLRRELLSEAQSKPEGLETGELQKYVGEYHHAGYHTFKIEIKDGRLFSDATDRSGGFFLSFDHIHSGRVFVARLHMAADENEWDDFQAGFELSEDAKTVTKMGLRIEPAIEDLIWFDRIES